MYSYSQQSRCFGTGITNVLSTFQKHYLVTNRTLRFLPSNSIAIHNVLLLPKSRCFWNRYNKRSLYVSKTLSRNPQDNAVSFKQFHCDTQRTPTPNKADVFGTGITNVLSAFQKRYLATHRTMQFLSSNSIAIHNVLLRPTKQMFLEQV